MPRARPNEPTPADELFSMLTRVPAWVGPVLALVAFVGCRWILPFCLGLIGGAGGGDAGKMINTTMETFSNLAVALSPFAALFVLAIWAAAEVKQRVDGARLDRQTGSDSISALTWSEFESLLAEAFRRHGYVVEHSGGPRPDGGVDLRLSKAGANTLVQCKHWKARSVGVKVVRELRGVVASEGAHAGIVVTSGGYTSDAIAFAATNPIRLIDGPELCEMIVEVRKTGGAPKGSSPERAARRNAAAAPVTPTSPLAPTISIPDSAPVACPNCGSAMVERIAKTGKRAGSAFLGCSQFPKCRGTLQLGVERRGSENRM